MKELVNAPGDHFDEVLLMAMKEPRKRFYFYQALLDIETVVLGTVLGDGEEPDLRDAVLNLRYFKAGEGLFLPVFTSWEKFKSIMGADNPYIRISFSMLLEAVDTSIPWVLNPGFEPGWTLIPDELETLKDRSILRYCFDKLSNEEKEQLSRQAK